MYNKSYFLWNWLLRITTGLFLANALHMTIDYDNPSHLTNVNDTLFFASYDGFHFSLWKSDGTDRRTVFIKEITPFEMVAVGPTLFFTVNDDDYDQGLWKSDGTSQGTILVKDTCLACYSYVSNLTYVNGVVFFTDMTSLWTSDGTTEGTQPLLLHRGASALTGVNKILFFNNGGDLWKSDGTPNGTVQVRDFSPGSIAAFPMINFNGILFFAAEDATNGVELWRSDGTETGTFLVKDIHPGPGSSNPFNLTPVNELLFFSADQNGDANASLWVSNGTKDGTILVKDVYVGSVGVNGSDIPGIVSFKDQLFFTANDQVHGFELWKSDGTFDGTVLLKDIQPNSVSSLPDEFTVVGDHLFFSAGFNDTECQLWQSDGTTQGTILVEDLCGESPYPIRDLINVNGWLYFTAKDPSDNLGATVSLWRSNGSPAGTYRISSLHFIQYLPVLKNIQ